MLLVDQKYSLCGYKAVFAIPYSLIKRTKMAAESSGFQIRTYYTFLQQAEKDNKPCCLKFLLGTELCICCQSSNDQWVCTDLSFFFFSLQFFHMRFPFLFSFKSYSTGLFSKSKGQSVSWHVVWPQHQWHPMPKHQIRGKGGGELPPQFMLGVLLSYRHYKYCFDWHGKGLYFWHCRYTRLQLNIITHY